MSEEQILWMAGMVVAAFICGFIVLMVNDWYRFEDLAESNRDYYMAVEPDIPGR